MAQSSALQCMLQGERGDSLETANHPMLKAAMMVTVLLKITIVKAVKTIEGTTVELVTTMKCASR